MISKSPKLSELDIAKITGILEAMEADGRYKTPPSYSPDTKTYPNNVVSYTTAKLTYIKKYPNIDPYQYIENLKLVTRI